MGEIQAATGGDVSYWGWIRGQDNIADWVTHGRNPEEIGHESEWFKGPKFLSLSLEEWNLKFFPAVSDVLLGEKNVVGVNKIDVEDSLSLCCKRSSSLHVMKWAVAHIISALRVKTFKGGRRSNITAELLRIAEKALVKEAQSGWTPESGRAQQWSFRYGGDRIILASRMGGHSRVQNKPAPAGLYEAKAQSCSRVHIINCDYQS